MAPIEPAFQTPLILTGLCYLGGMALFLAVLSWEWWMLQGAQNIGSLGQTVGRWLLRILMAVVVASLMFTLFRGMYSPEYFLPELSLLLFVIVLYLKSLRDHNINQASTAIPVELLKVAGVTFVCMVGWIVSFSLGWCVFQLSKSLPGNLDGLAVFVIGILWNGPLVLLYLGIQKRHPDPDLKFHKILWPVLLAYFLIMLPEFIELVVNSPKFHELMNAVPALQRV